METKEQNKISSNLVLPAVFVGQVLYRQVYSRNEPPMIKECTVGRVGKKYFYLTGYEDRYPIGKESLLYESKDYSQNNFQLYRTEQEILDLNEKAKLTDRLKKHFDWSGNYIKNTLSQLRQAYDVLCGGDENCR